jgi:predicted alpha/beta superfamily hydrolase
MFINIILINLCSISDVSAGIRLPTTKTIHSKVLGEEREFSIQLPIKYDINTEQNYQVLYLLDGPSQLSHTSGMLDFLVGYGQAPQLIIVAITHKQRNLDLTPTHDSDKEFPNGGGEKFLDFIEQELMPHINKTYRTEPFNLIAGHSLGGLLVMHSLATRPHLFQAHFAYSPSLYWDNNVVLKQAEKFLKETKSFKNYLYINMGNEGLERGDDRGMAMRNGVLSLTALLNSEPPKDFLFRADVFEQENHQTTPIIGQFHAYRSLYPNWALPWNSSGNELADIKQHYDGLTKRYGYLIKPLKYEINDAGYVQLTEKDNVEEAIKLFEFNVKRFPECGNCYDSLADGYEQQGKLDEALSLLNKASRYSADSASEMEMITNHKKRIVALINEENKQAE